ncbi:MAG: SprB repeat-containing protein, partial [Bacteroidia bacterium]|nr:SprB repeat-containing protein [Bacteroidia bacterium]MDW8334469.1 SprB repeat-containing protein [Bacteroidia bacterium]
MSRLTISAMTATLLLFVARTQAQVTIAPANPNVCAGEAIVFAALGTFPPNAHYEWCELWHDGTWHILGYGPIFNYHAFYDATIGIRVSYYDPAAGDTVVFYDQTTVSVQNIEAFVHSTDASCYTCSDGSFSLEVAGDNPPFSFELNGVTTTNPVFTGLSPGQYQVNITDAVGCTTQAWVWIGYTPSFNVSLGPDFVEIACGDSYTVVLSVTPPGNYQNTWRAYNVNTGGEYFFQNINSLTVAGGTSVYVEVTNPETGETAYAQATVYSPPLEVEGTITHASCAQCADGAISVTASGTPPFSYYWYHDGQTTNVITGLSPGHYDVRVTDATGCVGWGSFLVGPYPSDSSSGWLQTDEYVAVPCGESDSIVVRAYPPEGVDEETIAWYDAEGNLVGTGAQIVFSTSHSQSLRVVAHHANGQTLTGYVWIYVQGPQVYLTHLQHPSCSECSDGSASFEVLDAQPPLTVVLNGDSFVFHQTQFTIDNLAYGDYSLSITDAEGCVGTTFFFFYPDTAENGGVEVSGPETASCGDTITLVGHAPEPATQFNFWLSESGDTLGFGVELTVVVTRPTVFKFVSINMLTGERLEGVHEVLVQGFEVSGTTTHASCNVCTDGQIVLTTLNGVPPYSFHWSNEATTQNISGLAPGYYWVTVEDARGCVATAEFVVGCHGGGMVVNGMTSFGQGDPHQAVVRLLAYFPQTEDTTTVGVQTTDGAGYFSFETPFSEDVVYYLVAQTQAPNYIPTYYPSAYAIQDAQPIPHLGCTQYFAAIEMISLFE